MDAPAQSSLAPGGLASLEPTAAQSDGRAGRMKTTKGRSESSRLPPAGP
jgi:hypothetical protein